MVDQTELRRLAEKATPGPWHYSDVHASVTCDAPQDVDHNHFRGFADPDYEGRYLLCESVVHPPTRAYIAAMHPATTLALLDRLARAETLVAQGRATLEAMHPSTGIPNWDVARLYNAMMEALGDEQG